jgi:hypothetical protein
MCLLMIYQENVADINHCEKRHQLFEQCGCLSIQTRIGRGRIWSTAAIEELLQRYRRSLLG